MGPDGPGPGEYEGGAAAAQHVPTPFLGPQRDADGGDGAGSPERAAWLGARAGPGPGEYDPGPGPQHRVPLGLILPLSGRDGAETLLAGPARDWPGPGAYDPARPVSARASASREGERGDGTENGGGVFYMVR
jgi:hypothetical protein